MPGAMDFSKRLCICLLVCKREKERVGNSVLSERLNDDNDDAPHTRNVCGCAHVRMRVYACVVKIQYEKRG